MTITYHPLFQEEQGGGLEIITPKHGEIKFMQGSVRSQELSHLSGTHFNKTHSQD